MATPENERRWLEAAHGKSLRQIEQLVSGRKPGDGPDAPASESARHVLRFDVSAETMATFRDAMEKLRRQSATPLDDDAALLLLARAVLEGPADSGRANYQIAFTVCEACERGFQTGHGEPLEVDASITEMAQCDAQHLGSVGSSELGAHVGAGSVANAPRKARATRTIPPAIRRAVLRRDSGRCRVPGCRHARFVDVHHLDLRSEGGGHDPERVVVLCAAHHRAFHRGELVAVGTNSAGLLFRHADGSAYGQVAAPDRAEAYTKAFEALRRLGFREGEARRALQRVRELGDSPSSIEGVLRKALALLSETHSFRPQTPVPVSGIGAVGI